MDELDQKILDEFQDIKNEVNSIVDKLVENAIETHDTYEQASKSISNLRFEFIGLLGKTIIEEAISKVGKIAMKKATKL